MKRILGTLAMGFAATVAQADGAIEHVATAYDVTTAADNLVATIEGAGATVMARIDHGAGAASVGADIGGSQLVVFGNPAVGTPAMVDARLAGLYLPMRVLVYEDSDGQVWLAYEDPQDMLGDVDGINADAEYIAMMTKALGNLTAKAAE